MRRKINQQQNVTLNGRREPHLWWYPLGVSCNQFEKDFFFHLKLESLQLHSRPSDTNLLNLKGFTHTCYSTLFPGKMNHNFLVKSCVEALNNSVWAPFGQFIHFSSLLFCCSPPVFFVSIFFPSFLPLLFLSSFPLLTGGLCLPCFQLYLPTSNHEAVQHR